MTYDAKRNHCSNLLVLGYRVGVYGYLVNFDFVKRPVVAVHGFPLHQVQGLKPVDDLAIERLTLPKTVYCLLSLVMRL